MHAVTDGHALERAMAGAVGACMHAVHLTATCAATAKLCPCCMHLAISPCSMHLAISPCSMHLAISAAVLFPAKAKTKASHQVQLCQFGSQENERVLSRLRHLLCGVLCGAWGHPALSMNFHMRCQKASCAPPNANHQLPCGEGPSHGQPPSHGQAPSRGPGPSHGQAPSCGQGPSHGQAPSRGQGPMRVSCSGRLRHAAWAGSCSAECKTCGSAECETCGSAECETSFGLLTLPLPSGCRTGRCAPRSDTLS